jgi:hypothetical protein
MLVMIPLFEILDYVTSIQIKDGELNLNLIAYYQAE